MFLWIEWMVVIRHYCDLKQLNTRPVQFNLQPIINIPHKQFISGLQSNELRNEEIK